jgi:hypothetical protein
MRRNVIRLIFFLFFTGTAAFAAEAAKAPTAAAEDLKHVSVFAFGGVGFAGTTSLGEKEFRVIFSQDSLTALHQFEDIYANGNVEARCYALVALRRLNPARFQQLVSEQAASDASVRTMRGCLMETERLADLLQQITRGSFDVQAFTAPAR